MRAEQVQAYSSEREGGFAGVVKSAVEAEFACQPTLHAVTPAISVHAAHDAALLDIHTLLHSDSALDEIDPMVAADVDAIQRLAQLSRQAHTWVLWMYSYRALQRTVRDGGEQRRLETYGETRRVIEPVVHKLQELLDFTAAARTIIVNEFQALLQQRRSEVWWNEDRLRALIEALDELMVLDLLKDSKSGLNNDFAAWRRAVNALSRGGEGGLGVGGAAGMQHALALMVDQDLHKFVSTKMCIVTTLLEALHRVRLEKETYGVVAAHLLRLCLSAAEGQGDAAALGQRQRAHRMLALGLAMLGDTADDVAKVASGKGQFKDGKSGAPLDAPKVYKGAAAFLTSCPVDSFRA